MLFQCWASVKDVGPTLKQPQFNACVCWVNIPFQAHFKPKNMSLNWRIWFVVDAQLVK